MVTGRKEGVLAGRVDEARKLLVRMGTVRFGAPDATVKEILNAVTSIERLETLAVRLLNASSWTELLAQ